MTSLRRIRKLGIGLLGVISLLIAAHWGLNAIARPTPPALRPLPRTTIEITTNSRRLGQSEVALLAALNLARLSGSPEEIGVAHARLLYGDIVETERRFYSRFQQYVPLALKRSLLLELAQLRFFDIDKGMTIERRREIAAMAATFDPDPFSSLFPSYQRLIYLNAIYDISLSFEGSPLLGCTTLFVAAQPDHDQHTLFARNFDFEVDPVFDEKKTLFIVKETGKIPYLSLSWPGLIGSVTGVNQKGLAIVVHGGRAGTPRRKGKPILHILRDVLGAAENVEQAYTELQRHPIMVSHIIVMADPSGRAEVVERVPGQPAYRYQLSNRAAVTNHLIGPSANDPKNQRVIANTSTVERQLRGQQLLHAHEGPLAAKDLVGFLRDRRAVNGGPLPLGDRRALGALIAAHGVAFDLTARRLWVGGTPTLLGPYYELSLDALFDETVPLVSLLDQAERIEPDPILRSPEYVEHRRRLPH